MATKNILGAYKGLRTQLEEGKKLKLGLGLDDFFRMSPGEVLIMMARAGVGKTAWAINIIQHLVEQGYSTLFFSLEMTAEQILSRLLQLYYGLPKYLIEQGIKTQGEEFVKEFIQVYADFHVVDDNSLTTTDIRWKTQTVDPDVMVIDYLQYIGGYGGSAYEKATATTRALKALAKDCKVPVLVLSQTSRAAGDGSHRITMEMGRDTGAIEETADYLLGAWRRENGRIRVEILKNRHGETGSIDYYFDAPLMRFQPQSEVGY